MKIQKFLCLEFGAQNKTPEKLIILLHGWGVHAGYMEKMARRIEQDIPEALILCPHALEPANSNPENLIGSDQKRRWFDMDGSPEEVKPRLLNAVKQMNGFIDHCKNRFDLDDSDIALMGFSQGGTMALYTAYSRAQDISHVVAHSAPFHEASFSPACSPDTLFIYGKADEVFTEDQFKGWAKAVKQHVENSSIKTVENLSHRTSSESCRIVSSYMKEKLSP